MTARRGIVRRSLAGICLAVGPFAWTVATIAYCIVFSNWLLVAPWLGAWAALPLILLPLAGEIVFTRAYEAAVYGWRPGVVLGLAARLIFTAFLTYLFIWLPIDSRNSAMLWFAQDLSTAHLFLRIVWIASPVPALVLALVCAVVYAAWTVRTRRGRLTTTVVFPTIATCALFVLMYQYPDAAIRHAGERRPDFVVRVWDRVGAEHRFPREVMVTADERYAIATFGSTFPIESSSPPPNDLGLDPQRCDPQGPNPGECRRNLVLIDLTTGATKTWTTTMTRRFFAESDDRFFVAPWNLSDLLELHLDGSVRKYSLPQEIGGIPLREVNMTYYAADVGRVYMTSGNNPLLLAWDVRSAQLEPPRRFAGWNGIDAGDSSISMARSRSRHRLYVLVKSEPNTIVELDENSLEPLRSIKPAPDAIDIQITPDEAHLYMASFLTGRIFRYGTDSLALEATLDAPIQCRRVALSPDGALLFAASYPTGELVVYDTRTNEKRDSFFVAPRLEGMHVAGGGLYMLSAEGLYRVSLDVLRDRALGPASRCSAQRGCSSSPSEAEGESSGKGSG
jgi:hypothetical protein